MFHRPLKDLLKQLRLIHKGESSESAHLPKNRDILIYKSDQLLKMLCWDLSKARDFLKTNMNTNTRDLLNIEELIKFNSLLELELDNIQNPITN